MTNKKVAKQNTIYLHIYNVVIQSYGHYTRVLKNLSLCTAKYENKI